jgi:hypothetical protein
MNSTCGSTPPNPNLDLPNRSTDLHKTLVLVGTPHGESIAKFMSTKTCQIKRNRRNPAKNSSNPRPSKNPKSSLLTHGFGRGIKEKRTTKGSHIHPHQIPKSKVPKTHQEIHQERAPKIIAKNTWEQHNQALRNHAESSIHTKEIHTRSSLPPDHPTLSQDLTMKLSSKSNGNRKKIGRENNKANELGFQEMAAILSPLGYMEATKSLKYPY